MDCKFYQGVRRNINNTIVIDGWCILGFKLEGDNYILKACKHNSEPCKNYTEEDRIETPARYISKSVRYEVLNRQHWCCNICACKLKYSMSHIDFDGKVAHIDHIHPFSMWETYKGDINEVSNLQALCPECNMKKHSKEGF